MPLDISRLSLIDQLLGPIQKVIGAILPGFIKKDLNDPEVRDALVSAADAALIANFPAAAAIPTEIRRKLIRKQLDLIIDDVLVGE
jgi:hypothetical protein